MFLDLSGVLMLDPQSHKPVGKEVRMVDMLALVPILGRATSELIVGMLEQEAMLEAGGIGQIMGTLEMAKTPGVVIPERTAE